MRSLALAVACVLALLGGQSVDASRSAGDETLRVLFVGNSLTATNDLPRIVAALAQAGGRSLEARSVTFGGFNLEDHWNAGLARDVLARGDWDVVVMQQGPSALPESQVNLAEWATRFAGAARAAGTSPALLTVWPESYRQEALRDVVASYRNAAREAGATLLPAGAAWQAGWRCRPRLGLYGADGFHPSSLGSYTAALVVYGRLFSAPVKGLPGDLGPYGVEVTIGRQTAAVAQWAAAVALGRKPGPFACGR